MKEIIWYNENMSAALSKLKRRNTSQIAKIEHVLDDAIIEWNGCFVRNRIDFSKGLPEDVKRACPDESWIERWYNEYFVGEYLKMPIKNSDLLINGLLIITVLANKLKNSFPLVPFRLYLFYDYQKNSLASTTARVLFHKIRPGQEIWPGDRHIYFQKIGLSHYEVEFDYN